MIFGMARTPRGINSIHLVLDHASRLFLINGYRNTTVEQIARDAKLSKGAVYFHFPDKAALALRLLQRADEQLLDAITEAQRGTNPKDQLVRFLHQRSLLGQQRPDFWLLTVMFSVEFAGTDSTIEARVRRIYGRLQEFLETLIRQGAQEGLFDAELPAAEQAAIIVATHDGMLLQWLRRSRELDGEQLVRAMRRSVLRGLSTAAEVAGDPQAPRRAQIA